MTRLSGGSFADDDGLHLDLEGVEALLVRQVQLVAQLAAHLLQRLRLGRLLLELGLPHHRQLQPEGREQKTDFRMCCHSFGMFQVDSLNC